MEENLFLQHRETIMTIITESGENGVLIEEIEEETEIPEDLTRRLVQSLLGTKLFQNFFNQLDFQEETRKEATQRLLTIAQKYGKPLHINMVRHVT